MFASRNAGAIVASLVFAVFLWGGNNTGVKFLVHYWPPVWVGSTRFICAGLLLFALLRWTTWMGPSRSLTPALRWQLWWRTGLSLAVYIVAFNGALHYTSASHVALYLGAAPVWALLWEGRGEHSTPALLKRFGAAALALLGVFVLFWPVLHDSNASYKGEFLGLAGSVLWTLYGRQCRHFGAALSGVEITAHSMWRAGILLLPFGIIEIAIGGIVWGTTTFLVQAYCIVAGAVVAFALWTNALRHWKTSEVYLFNNLIPLSTMSWAYFCLDEKVTPTFWVAMALIVSGVLIGQANWQKILGARWLPMD